VLEIITKHLQEKQQKQRSNINEQSSSVLCLKETDTSTQTVQNSGGSIAG
jgi:hypothetical protein